jgi:hypothetical protein
MNFLKACLVKARSDTMGFFDRSDTLGNIFIEYNDPNDISNTEKTRTVRAYITRKYHEKKKDSQRSKAEYVIMCQKVRIQSNYELVPKASRLRNNTSSVLHTINLSIKRATQKTLRRKNSALSTRYL